VFRDQAAVRFRTDDRNNKDRKKGVHAEDFEPTGCTEAGAA
jgi:hypothetical protein